MKRPLRTPAQRRAAQRLAHLGRSVKRRAADEPLGRVRGPRDSLAPRPPRPPAELAAPGFAALAWQRALPEGPPELPPLSGGPGELPE
jgi:hypothetical protein